MAEPLPEPLDVTSRARRRRAALLAALAALESEPSLLGVSAHLLAVARPESLGAVRGA